MTCDDVISSMLYMLHVSDKVPHVHVVVNSSVYDSPEAVCNVYINCKTSEPLISAWNLIQFKNYWYKYIQLLNASFKKSQINLILVWRSSDTGQNIFLTIFWCLEALQLLIVSKNIQLVCSKDFLHHFIHKILYLWELDVF